MIDRLTASPVALAQEGVPAAHLDVPSAADFLMQDGIILAVQAALDRTQGALDRGSYEVADTHFKHALEGLKVIGDTLVSPLLDQQENNQWRVLRNKGWEALPDGTRVLRIPLCENEAGRLRFLNEKAQGLPTMPVGYPGIIS
jgi:hypothetical protein